MKVDKPTMVPQVAPASEQALARAHAALGVGDISALATSSIAAHHLLYAAAAVIALLASAAGYRLLRHPVPTAPMGEASPHLPRYAQVAPQSGVAELAPPLAAQSKPARAAPMAGKRAAIESAAKEDTAVEELQLLKRAQLSAARGDHAAVLAITTEHELRYPDGHLCEEREALRLRALTGLGRGHEAREAAGRFRRAFPRSVLLSKLNDMLVSSP